MFVVENGKNVEISSIFTVEDGKYVEIGSIFGVEDGKYVELMSGNAALYAVTSKYASSSGNNYNGTLIYKSEDKGETWKLHATVSGISLNSVTYGNGLFVAISHEPNAIYYSSDAKTWTKALNASNNATSSTSEGLQKTMKSVIYNQDHKKFVVAGMYSEQSNLHVWTSTNGVNWTKSYTPKSDNSGGGSGKNHHKLYFDGKYYVYISGSCDMWYSEDATTWAQATVGTSTYLNLLGISHGDGKTVMTGYFDTDYNDYPRVGYFTTDPSSPTLANVDNTYSCDGYSAVLYHDNRFLGLFGNRAFQKNQGESIATTWTHLGTTSMYNGVSTLEYFNGRYQTVSNSTYASGTSSGRLLQGGYSFDGVSWTLYTIGQDSVLYNNFSTNYQLFPSLCAEVDGGMFVDE